MDKRLLVGESKYVEYKSDYTSTMLKTVSAFSNYHDGYILIGVDDDGSVIGVDNSEELRLSIENAINDSLDPRPYYEIEAENLENRDILIITVYKGEHTPYLYKNKTYKRMDTSTVQVNRIEHGELVMNGRNQKFESIKVDNDSLSFNALGKKMKDVLNIQEMTRDLLITLELRDSSRFNNAGLMISDDNNMDSSRIQLIAYNDDTVMDIRDRQEIKNVSILEEYDKCMDFFFKHINRQEKIDGPYRRTIEEVPLVAYREAVANAIIHRDYSRDASIRISVFSDRIEIVSPGSLPIGISEEEYRKGNLSILRNRIIADVFLRLKIIEKLGTGIIRIKGYYQDYDVQPLLEVYENSIKVVLPKVTDKANALNSTYDKMLESLNEREIKVIELLMNNDALSRREIESYLDLKRTQTGEVIKKLRDKELIIKLGTGRSIKYKINR